MCCGLHGMVKWDSVCWECCHTKSRGSLFWSRVCLELQNFRSFWYGAKLSNHILQQEIVTIEYNWPKKIYDSAKLYDIPNISPQPFLHGYICHVLGPDILQLWVWSTHTLCTKTHCFGEERRGAGGRHSCGSSIQYQQLGIERFAELGWIDTVLLPSKHVTNCKQKE